MIAALRFGSLALMLFGFTAALGAAAWRVRKAIAARRSQKRIEKYTQALRSSLGAADVRQEPVQAKDSPIKVFGVSK